MTRYVVDARAAIELARRNVRISADDELLAPTLIRSQTLSLLHEAVANGDMKEEVARDLHERIGKMKMRLLGDAVLRRRAWAIASEMGWASTFDAEYVALTQLQGDALVTLDKALARSVKGLVATVPLKSIGAG